MSIERDKLGSKRLPALLAILLGILAISSALERSAAVGRLSVPPAYDDIGYILGGLDLYSTFLERGLTGVLIPLLHEHAPFQTMLALMGDFLFGIHPWSPYLANGLLLIAFILVLLVLTRDARPLGQFALIAYVISLPLTGNLIAEFRPDFYWGLLCGIAIYLIFDPDFLEGGHLRTSATAVCVALALLAKPSASPATAVLLGLAALLAIWCKDKLHSRLADLAIFASTLAVLAGPFLLINARTIYDYFYTVTVDQKDIWALRAPFWEQASFYISGWVREGTLGSAFWLGIVLFLWNSGYLYIKRRRAELIIYTSFGFVTFVAYLIPTISPVKSAFLGSLFYGTFIFIVIRSLVLVFQQSKVSGDPELGHFRVVQTMAPVALLLFTLLTFHGWVLFTTSAAYNGPEWTRAYDNLATAIENAVVDADLQKTAVVFVTSAYPISDANITLLGRLHRTNMRGDPGYYIRQLSAAEEEARKDDFILISQSKFIGTYPGAKLGLPLLEWLKNLDDFYLISELSFDDGLHTYLFKKRTFSLTGASGEWITSAGVTLHVMGDDLNRRPLLVLEGDADYDALGGKPEPHAVLSMDAGASKDLPAWLIASGQRYRLVIDCRELFRLPSQKYSIKLTFDRYFVPKKLGMNNDIRELVIRTPTVSEMKSEPPVQAQ